MMVKINQITFQVATHQSAINSWIDQIVMAGLHFERHKGMALDLFAGKHFQDFDCEDDIQEMAIARYSYRTIGWALRGKWSKTGDRATANAVWVFVHPDFRKMGIGKKLVRLVKE